MGKIYTNEELTQVQNALRIAQSIGDDLKKEADGTSGGIIEDVRHRHAYMRARDPDRIPSFHEFCDAEGSFIKPLTEFEKLKWLAWDVRFSSREATIYGIRSAQYSFTNETLRKALSLLKDEAPLPSFQDMADMRRVFEQPGIFEVVFNAPANFLMEAGKLTKEQELAFNQCGVFLEMAKEQVLGKIADTVKQDASDRLSEVKVHHTIFQKADTFSDRVKDWVDVQVAQSRSRVVGGKFSIFYDQQNDTHYIATSHNKALEVDNLLLKAEEKTGLDFHTPCSGTGDAFLSCVFSGWTEVKDKEAMLAAISTLHRHYMIDSSVIK